MHRTACSYIRYSLFSSTMPPLGQDITKIVTRGEKYSRLERRRPSLDYLATTGIKGESLLLSRPYVFLYRDVSMLSPSICCTSRLMYLVDSGLSCLLAGLATRRFWSREASLVRCIPRRAPSSANLGSETERDATLRHLRISRSAFKQPARSLICAAQRCTRAMQGET